MAASQTVGPFFSPALLRTDAERHILTQPETAGERIRIEGRVLDGDGVPVPDALVEIWQANASGRYNHPADTGPAKLDASFLGFGYSGTGEDGKYWFETIKPGAVPFGGAWMQAPHICVTVFARGMLNQVVTRLYFENEPANESDPVFQHVPADRRPAMAQEHERAAGGWQAEWSALPDLFRYTAGAVWHVREAVGGLQIDAARMQANLDQAGGLLMAESLTMALAPQLGRPAAQRVVQTVCEQAISSGSSLCQVALLDTGIRALLSPEAIERALDPRSYLGSADTWMNRALEAYREIRPG